MKKISEFWVPILAPAFLFIITYCMFNDEINSPGSIAKIIMGSILFIVVHIVLHKLLSDKIPDVLVRANLPMECVAVMTAFYLSGILSDVEIKISLVFLGIVLFVGIMSLCFGVKK